jgi:hypothetical protein
MDSLPPPISPTDQQHPVASLPYKKSCTYQSQSTTPNIDGIDEVHLAHVVDPIAGLACY